MGLISYIILFFMQLFPQLNEDFCRIKNTTTQNGEEISYTVFYHVAGVYAKAGSAVFSNKVEQLNGRAVFHITGVGGSNEKYDWIYRVRDRYESYIDTLTMKPVRFARDVHEGRTRKLEKIVFDHESKTATTDSGVYKMPDCIQDVLSSIYFARNIDFNQYKKGDRIHFNLFLENEVHPLYIRYLGKEKIKTRYGSFNAIKFKPLLVEGTIFSGGEKMTVWVSDDGNRIPLRIQSEILIGSVRVDMMGCKGLRYRLGLL
jgi:hypothetical protein